jgi:hypothetical protein
MSERDIDDAIDRALREVMDVAAAGDLRGRVLARIEGPPSGRFPLFTFAAGASVAAAVLAAFVLVGSRDAAIESPPPERPSVPAAAAVPPSEPARPSTEPPTFRPVSRPAPVDREPLEPGRLVAATADEEEEPGFEIAPLSAIDPIAISPLQPSAIAAPEVSIVPLTPIVEVHVEPLYPSSGRN